MNRRTFLTATGAALTGAALGARVAGARPAGARPAGARQRRPNVVLIMADDMGYSDTGAFGGEIRTPSVDRLAAEGVRFAQFYNCARCVPTRGALLTGLYPHQAGVGHMLRQVMRGYMGQLGDDTVTIAEALKPAGYATAMSGKWHLSHLHVRGKDQLDFRSTRPWWDTKASWPVARGFDEFYGTIAGVENFFDPFSLVHGETLTYPESDAYYYTDAIADHAARTIRANARAGRPFFHYVAFTAPHWPLHALEEDVARYDGVYDVGWDAVREARWRRLVELGLIRREWALSPRDPAVRPWADTPDRDWEARRMAVYAAMIDRMDQGIGRILDALREGGVEEDTLVLFLSDNGASAEDVQPEWYDIPSRTRRGDSIRVDNAPAVRAGPQTSWTSYEAGWANASNAPFRRFKKWVHEGGIATPFVARWPAVARDGGAVTQQVGHVIDVMATVLDAAGAAYPRARGGRRVVPLEGRSLLPALRGRERDGHDALCWEHEGSQAIRRGRWKLVMVPDGAWELYDMDADRTELHDLAAERPALVRELSAEYARWMGRTGVLPFAEYVRMRDSAASHWQRPASDTGAAVWRPRRP